MMALQMFTVCFILVLAVLQFSEAQAHVKGCEFGILTDCSEHETCYIPKDSKKRSGICVPVPVPAHLQVESAVADTCGGTLTNATGKIQFSSTQANTTCVWYIQREAGDKQTSMQLTYEMSGKGQIVIYEGNKSSEIVKYGMGSDSATVVSLEMVTTIIYTGGASVIPSDVLTMSYNTKECKQTVDRTVSGFRSPVYKPGKGPISCHYTVTNNGGQGMPVLSFNKFSITNGHLTVTGTGLKPTNLSGSVLPDDIVNATKIEMDLVINNFSVAQLFEVYFPRMNPECSGYYILDDNTETVAWTLPNAANFPAECRQYIQTSNAQSKLVVMVTNLKLTAAADDLLFQDGGSISARTISQFGSMKETNKMVLSSGKTLIVRTLLQEKSSPRNVTLSIHQQAYGGRFSDKGRLELKSNGQKLDYPIYYLLNVASGQQAQLVMNKSYMYPNASLDVYDGDSTKQRKLVSFGSQDVPFFPVTSSGNTLFVVASNFVSNQSFTADFSTAKPGCSVVSTETVGNYDLLRQNLQTQCSWTINPQLTKGTVLMKLKSVNLCPNETVTLYQGLSKSGTVRLATFTHNSGLTDIPLFASPAKSGIKVVVNHNGANCSKNTTSKTVISAYYSTQPTDCTGILPAPNGKVTSPEFPNQYPLNSKCTWKTPVLNQKTFYLSLNQMQLNRLHSLNVSMLKGSVPKQLVSYTGNTLPQDFLVSLTNKTVFVDFDSTTKSRGTTITKSGQGFSLTYRYLDCGGYFTKSDGEFGIPKAVSTNKECIWIVRLPKSGAKNSTNIVSFNLTSSSMADVNKNLVIRDGGSVRDKVLVFDTTKAGAKPVLSRTNYLWVKYTFNKKQQSTTTSAGFTFKLEYKTYSCDKKHQCDNGICLHPDWKCNGKDDCGDNTDERNCNHQGGTTEEGVKVYIVVIVALLCLAIGVVLTIVLPAVYKRIKYPNYSQLKDMMEPSIA